MPWHDHSDSQIQPTAPKPVGQQKMADTTSAASNAAAGIGSIGNIVKAIAGKSKGGGGDSQAPYGANSD